jgi:hypothetical protein|nr:MAG TPA: hypothetical protein [Caudoviricetes sp.]
MDEKKYILHFASGNKIISEKEAIANAIEQKNSGVTPLYKRSGSDARGWLVWSTFEDGAGVVFQREDGSAYVSTGLQGDFSI